MTQRLIDAFVGQVIENSNFTELDRYYLANRVMAWVGEDGLDTVTDETDLIALKEALVPVATDNGRVEPILEAQDCLGATLMDLVTPSPSQVNQDFWSAYQTDPQVAIADFYALSQRNDYIKVAAIAKNIYYTTPTDYGELEITINLSKPEKDPKAIASAKAAKQSNYPKCQLCMENEGYQGRINHPARANHRIIRMDLGGEAWGFQYSPYAYFNEHSIILNTQHVPMVISQQTYAQLLDIVDLLPGYFAGSNADLPIVGGSILTHNHYQAGRHVFPMERAAQVRAFRFSGYEEIEASLLKWPMSVIRLRGTDKARLTALAERIYQGWRGYSDPAVDIVAETAGEPHHTVTPIARKKDGCFELDLVLRDNHTSAEFPDGVYHPHPDVQHIKKENIGLIEVMGLAILPPRLKDELIEVERYLLGQVDQVATYHQDWAEALKNQHPEVTAETVTQVVQDAVGQVFARVLEDAGVYKQDESGQAAFMRFIETIGLAQ